MLTTLTQTQRMITKFCLSWSPLIAQRGFTKKPAASADESFSNPEEETNTKEAKKPIDPKNHEEEYHELTNEDVKKIKKLIADQDDEIEKLTKEVEKFKNEYWY